jgi:hypothetical protein
MSDDYLWDRSGPADPDVAKLEGLLAPLAHDAPLDELGLRRRRSRAPWFIGGAIVAVAAAVAIYLALPKKPGVPQITACSGSDGFAFTGIGGAVSCGGGRVAQGTLPVGGTLETGTAEARLTIADIGAARLGQNTKLRLERTDVQRHQLALDHGTMHAKVYAPPRLFAVTTPLTEVTDLGCEYDLTIAEGGVGSVTVFDGMVELATKTGTVVVVPEGCTAEILGAQRPGLPMCKAASPGIVEAILEYDAGDPAAADTILAKADRQDAVVLLALAAVDAKRRLAVLERLAELSPPPDVEITPELAATDPDLLAPWQQDVLEIYFGLFGPDSGGARKP